MNKFYVCTKFGCTWAGLISDMLEDYHYPQNATWFFASEEEANNKIEELEEERSLEHAK